MDNENKILKIVFAVLLVAVISEVVYFFATQKNQQPLIDNAIDQPTPPVANTFSGPANPDLPPLFNLKALDDLSLIPFYPNSKATVNIEIRNKVVDVHNTPITQGGRQYPVGLKFHYENGLEKWIHYEQKDIAKMKVFVDEGGGGLKQTANFSDIKKDDVVSIKTVINPYFPPDDARYLDSLELDIIR